MTFYLNLSTVSFDIDDLNVIDFHKAILQFGSTSFFTSTLYIEEEYKIIVFIKIFDFSYQMKYSSWGQLNPKKSVFRCNICLPVRNKNEEN